VRLLRSKSFTLTLPSLLPRSTFNNTTPTPDILRRLRESRSAFCLYVLRLHHLQHYSQILTRRHRSNNSSPPFGYEQDAAQETTEENLTERDPTQLDICDAVQEIQYSVTYHSHLKLLEPVKHNYSTSKSKMSSCESMLDSMSTWRCKYVVSQNRMGQL
jgi:hypothetical protein